MKIGDKVKLNNRYYASEEERLKIWEVASEPWESGGQMVVKLKGKSGSYAVDGLCLADEDTAIRMTTVEITDGLRRLAEIMEKAEFRDWATWCRNAIEELQQRPDVGECSECDSFGIENAKCLCEESPFHGHIVENNDFCPYWAQRGAVETEAVEVCPYCSAENSYPNWKIKKNGYVAKCHTCGEEIMLCDECRHADDNPGGKCDWRSETHGTQEIGICFRGVTVHPVSKDGLTLKRTAKNE